jgi:hypothetical protein
MTQIQSLSTALIGRNIQTALLVWKLMDNKFLNLSWHQTIEDQKKTSDDDWLFIFGQNELFDGSDLGVCRIQDVYFYSEGSRKVALSEILDPLKSQSPSQRQTSISSLPMALWRKAVSLSLFNDPTPGVVNFKDSQLGFDQQKIFWTNLPSVSWQTLGSDFQLGLMPRELALRSIEEKLKSQKDFEVVHGNQGAMGLQVQTSLSDSHKIINNAPFGITLKDRIIWSSPVTQPREEVDQRGTRKMNALLARPLAFWKGYGAFVDLKFVSALPIFSVHFDPLFSNRFMRTGILEQNCLKRVFVIPQFLHQKPLEKVWLQIEEFTPTQDFYAESQQGNSVSNLSGHEKMRFLEKLCPDLITSQEIELRELPIMSENLLFENPKSDVSLLSEGIIFNRASFLDSIENQTAELLTQLKIPRSLMSHEQPRTESRL